MLSNRTASQPSTIVIPKVDANGTVITASAASWELFDDRGVSVGAGNVTPYSAGDTSVTFTLSANALSLSDGVASAGRELVVTFTTTGGVVELRDYFLLVAARPLIVMVNSFVSYAEALAIRQSLGPSLDGWDATQDMTVRASALTAAYERLLRMSFSVPLTDGQNRASSYAAYGTGTDNIWPAMMPIRMRRMTLTTFDALPGDFTRAVKRAQLIEADVALGGDTIGKKRRDGVISETIGESSVFLNSKPYLNLPVSRQAYEELSRFVTLKIGIARA